MGGLLPMCVCAPVRTHAEYNHYLRPKHHPWSLPIFIHYVYACIHILHVSRLASQETAALRGLTSDFYAARLCFEKLAAIYSNLYHSVLCLRNFISILIDFIYILKYIDIYWDIFKNNKLRHMIFCFWDCAKKQSELCPSMRLLKYFFREIIV